VRMILTSSMLLLATLASPGCGTLKGGLDAFNPPPVHEGAGCYDLKGRKDHTIILEVECKKQGWIWKTE